MAKTKIQGTPEEQVRMLIAYDQLDIPLNSLHGKANRRSDKIAGSIAELVENNANFGNAIASVRYQDQQKARALREAVDIFCARNPAAGRELQTVIEDKRVEREVYLSYGLQTGSRLSANDYMTAMQSIGIGPARAEKLYPILLETSRDLQRARGREQTTCDPREILVG